MAGEGAADEQIGKEQQAAFGSCCAELEEAMSGREFEPLIWKSDGHPLHLDRPRSSRRRIP